MRCDHVDAVLLEILIEPIAVIGAIANEILRLGLQHVEVETELHQGDFMMICRVRTDREWQPMPINNCQDFHAFAAFGEADGLTRPSPPQINMEMFVAGTLLMISVDLT